MIQSAIFVQHPSASLIKFVPPPPTQNIRHALIITFTCSLFYPVMLQDISQSYISLYEKNPQKSIVGRHELPLPISFLTIGLSIFNLRPLVSFVSPLPFQDRLQHDLISEYGSNKISHFKKAWPLIRKKNSRPYLRMFCAKCGLI